MVGRDVPGSGLPEATVNGGAENFGIGSFRLRGWTKIKELSDVLVALGRDIVDN